MKHKNSIKKSQKEHNKLIIKTAIIPMIYLIVIIMLAISLHALSNKLFTLVFMIVLLMSIYTLFVIFFGTTLKLKKQNQVSIGFESLLGKSLRKLDLPVIYINNKGKLIWQNSNSSELNIQDHLTEIHSEVSKSSRKEEIIIQISGEKYLVLVTDIMMENDLGKLAVLINKTNESVLENTLEKTRISVGIITIDSYEDIIQGLSDIDRVNTVSDIDKEIVKWIGKYSGIVNKVEKDKYVYIIEKQYVKELEANSFEILEQMHKISEDMVKVPITISIGLSYDDESLTGRYKSALTALDIAMGRGGNQAVIKNNKKFEIFGDDGIQLDKTNKVRARMISQALKDIIEKSENVYIMGHKNTDIDCIGSAVGIYKIAKTYGKDAQIIVDLKHNTSTRTVIDRLKEDSSYEDAFLNKEDTKKLDCENALLVIVDTHKESYLAAPDLLEKFDKVVIIDHHRRGPEFIEKTILTYHEVYASSTSELVTELLMYLDDVKLTSREAEAIFSGIVIDTKNFTFKTGVRTFEVSAYLKKTGLDITEIKHMFQNDFETYMTKVNIVKNAEIIDGQIAMSICKQEHENMPVIAAQAADELLSITGILASFVLCEIDGVVMISGRSLGDINVQLILEKLGGGGHLTFAGAQIAGTTVEEAKEKLLDIIKEYFKKKE